MRSASAPMISMPLVGLAHRRNRGAHALHGAVEAGECAVLLQRHRHRQDDVGHLRERRIVSSRRRPGTRASSARRSSSGSITESRRAKSCLDDHRLDRAGLDRARQIASRPTSPAAVGRHEAVAGRADRPSDRARRLRIERELRRSATSTPPGRNAGCAPMSVTPW